ncbi:GNAT family N-acetyltransferase [Brevibacillus sp. IT-7CA2]|uniref:N-acetyltransferase n=1 Tax=Brevibacillus sp. IT-7CA2 TaxID=3026436 RepID=UPI0039E146AD
MNVRFAVVEDIKQLEPFFSKHITRENKAVYNEEFLCPLGLRAAVKRQSVVVMNIEDIIIAAARIYLKKNGTISLYQFAVEEQYRHKNLMRYLLSQIGYPIFSACPSNLEFNHYYMDSKWSFVETKKGMNIWKLEPDLLSESTFPN